MKKGTRLVAFLLVFGALSSCAVLKRLRSSSDYIEKEGGLFIEMIAVEGGTFLMGSDERDSITNSDELPVHSVMLDDYYMSAYEITNEQYLVFCQATKRELPYEAEKRRGDSPAVHVSWDDANDFCQWLSGVSNKNYRLPSEAEWEYAARGGLESKGYIYAGGDILENVAAFSIGSVGKKKPNELGIYDMSGSVWEWCLDAYNAGYYKNSPKENPINLKPSINRVARGGGWSSAPKYHRISNRDNDNFTRTDNDLGFRIVLTKERE